MSCGELERLLIFFFGVEVWSGLPTALLRSSPRSILAVKKPLGSCFTGVDSNFRFSTLLTMEYSLTTWLLVLDLTGTFFLGASGHWKGLGMASGVVFILEVG